MQAAEPNPVMCLWEHPSKQALQHICFTAGADFAQTTCAAFQNCCSAPCASRVSPCKDIRVESSACAVISSTAGWSSVPHPKCHFTWLSLQGKWWGGTLQFNLAVSGTLERKTLYRTVEGIIPTQTAGYINSPKLLHAMGLSINVGNCSQSLCFVRPYLSSVSAVWHFRLQLLSEELCNFVGQTNLIGV